MSPQDRKEENISTASAAELPVYESPTIRVMNEDEVLSKFQITSAGITWWVM